MVRVLFEFVQAKFALTNALGEGCGIGHGSLVACPAPNSCSFGGREPSPFVSPMSGVRPGPVGF
ncbi:hypothetical protein GCM10009020_16850 [Natronoarchaeum mannanilyticum]|uniref:Uncharacterized protein n=1 Tax=Natronoarchaeum mannanilyticum TaxID=926360 RepID=A0AAV3T883_9EURY